MEVACFNKASLCVYFCSFVCQNKHTLREESKVAEATAITFSWNSCFWSQLPKQIAVLKTLVTKHPFRADSGLHHAFLPKAKSSIGVSLRYILNFENRYSKE